jgi:glycosyltransferase involved in cell wall biosynthesis
VTILRVRAWPAERDYYLSPGIVGAMRSSPYDVVHIQGYHTLVAPVAMLSAMRSNIPFVLAFHSGGHSSRVRRAMRGPQIRALRPLFGRAHRLVASSASELQYFKWRLGMPAAKFEMVPVLANLPQIADGVQDPFGNTLLVTVGRLEHYKGHQRVIEALPLLRGRVPNIRLRIVGEGPLESRLYQLAREHHVEDLVTIAAIPPTHRREMAEIMQRAALVISLSDFESAGLSIREALSLGRPVLVTDIAGYSDLHGSPLVNAIPLKSPIPVIANAIADSLRRTVVAEAADIPTWDECIDQFERIYRDAIGAR